MTLVPAAPPGAVSLHLGGREFLLRPSFAALAETEARAGCGIVPLARRFLDGNFGLGDVVAVLVPALRLAGGPADIDSVVIDRGVLSLAPVCARLLALALRPGEDCPNPLP